MTAQPDVCVVCPTFRRPHLLGRLVEALEAQTYPLDRVEVRIVDDASNDGTRARLAELAERTTLRLIPMETASNAGPAAARNAGWRASAAPLVAFTDDDCTPEPGWLSGAVAAFDDPRVGVVQGRVTRPAGVPLGPWTLFRESDGPTPYFEGCNIFYRRAALEQTGGFAEDIAWYGEDAEAGWRVLDAGWKRGYADGAAVAHDVEERGFGWHIRNGYLERNLIGVGARHPRFTAEAYWRPWAWRPHSPALVLALVGLAAAPRARPLAALALPWLWMRWPRRGYRTMPLLGPQRALVDLVQLAGHVEGSVRHRTLVL